MNLYMRRLMGAIEHGSYEWITPDTYTLSLKQRTRAKIYAVGSGADRRYDESWIMEYSASWVAGAGGGAFVGEAYLPSGIYTIKVGDCYHTKVKDLFSNHQVDSVVVNPTSIIHNRIGNLLTITSALIKSENFEIIPGTVVIDSSGTPAATTKTSGYYAGGASLYMGYGKGSDSNRSNYTTGYFKIEF